jgi:uncharacterized membrane protein YgaE (UPF0421/DUF939 family)
MDAAGFTDLVESSRRTFFDRLVQVKSKGFLAAQCAVAAGVAWWLAEDVFQQPSPLFAPLATLAALGTSYAQRLKRVVPVSLGIVLGVLVADVLLMAIGSGAWQISLISGVAILVALVLHDSPLVAAQAGTHAVIVTTVLPPPGVVFTRALDALLGGLVALVAAVIVPSAAIRRPGRQAAQVTDKLAELLACVAQVMRSGQPAPALRLLAEARNSQHLVDELQAAAEEGLDILDSSPFARLRHRGEIRRMAEVVVPLDRALRSTRVLVRQAAISARHGITVPEPYAGLAEDLANAAQLIAQELRDPGCLPSAQAQLETVAAATGTVARTFELANEAQLAQLRSITVDLLMVTGLSASAAMRAMPAPAPHPGAL